MVDYQQVWLARFNKTEIFELKDHWNPLVIIRQTQIAVELLVCSRQAKSLVTIAMLEKRPSSKRVFVQWKFASLLNHRHDK